LLNKKPAPFLVPVFADDERQQAAQYRPLWVLPHLWQGPLFCGISLMVKIFIGPLLVGAAEFLQIVTFTNATMLH
jgi:hypothetical protein